MSCGSSGTPAEFIRARIRRDLSRWSRKVLLCLGLENIGKHIVGEPKWEKLYDGSLTTPKTVTQERDEPPPNLDPPPDMGDECVGSAATITATLDMDVEENAAEFNAANHDEDVLDKTVESALCASPAGEFSASDCDKEDSSRVSVKDEGEESAENTPPSSPTNAPDVDLSIGRMEKDPSTPSSESAATDHQSAHVDNLFQILPYWYFLNRAIGMGVSSGAEESGSSTQHSAERVRSRELDEEEEDNGDERSDGRATPTVAETDPQGSYPLLDTTHASAATQRLNSIFLLESLRRQLRSNTGQELQAQSMELNQGVHLSDFLGQVSASRVPWGMDVAGMGGSAPEQEIDELVDQPLDLTSTVKPKNRESEGNCRPVFELDEHTSKVFRSNPRSSKGYTAQELQAALHDIQSGKLGTRRAAVIYGIPRSTLRNKVYKLGKDRVRLFNNSNGNSIQNNGTPQRLNNNNETNEERTGYTGKIPYLSSAHGNFLQPRTQRGGGSSQLSSSLRNTSAPVRLTNLSSQTEEESEEAIFLRHVRQSLCFSLNKGTGDGGQTHSNPSKICSNTSQSSLSQLISRHSQRVSHLGHSMRNTNLACSSTTETMLGDDCGTSALVNQRMDGESSALAQKGWKHALYSQQTMLERGAEAAQADHCHIQQQISSNEDSSTSSLSLDLIGKKSRPKRGKYRNYDREALVKAVRAVQNGEMSVHRAGSFFGVPHSTLEYKVKERHLLRRPKRKDATSPFPLAKSNGIERTVDSVLQSRDISSHQSNVAILKTGIGSIGTINSKGNHLPLSSQHLFPITSDLRESLSRYLGADNLERDDPSGMSPQHNDTGSGTEDEYAFVAKPDRKQEDDRVSASGKTKRDEGKGSSLPNLLQLNEFLLRNSEQGNSVLLDLSKK